MVNQNVTPQLSNFHLTVEELFAFGQMVLDEHVSFMKDTRDVVVGLAVTIVKIKLLIE